MVSLVSRGRVTAKQILVSHSLRFTLGVFKIRGLRRSEKTMTLPQMQSFFLNAWHTEHAYTQGGTQGDEPEVSASRTYAGGRSDDGEQRAGAQERGGTASCAANNDTSCNNLHKMSIPPPHLHTNKCIMCGL